MNQSSTKPATEAVQKAADDLDDLVRRAEAGDQAVVPRLWELLQKPGLADLLGNLAHQVQETVIGAMCGKNLAFREGLAKKMADMRAELAGPDPSPLERQLAERIVLCWLTLHESALRFASARDLSIKQADYWQRRIDCCHKRYLSAIKTLATVRKLAMPVLIGQLNIARKQVNTVGAPAPGGPGAGASKPGTSPQARAVA